MKKHLLAPAAALVLAGGFFAVSAVSAASAQGTPEEAAQVPTEAAVPMFLGEEAVFYSAEEGAKLFLDSVNADPALAEFDTSSAVNGAAAMFPAANEDGNPIEYEAGYIESVAATASRCIQISQWVTDPAVSPEEAQQLADEQFEEYESVPAIAELSDATHQQSTIDTLARASNEDPVELEAAETCGVFGTGGGNS